MNRLKDELKKIARKYRRHRYVQQQSRVLEVSGRDVLVPIHVCSKCGKRTGLDKWQMSQLPRNMKYGCKGVWASDKQ